MADEPPDARATIDAKPRGATGPKRAPADTDPIPLATLASAELARYWTGVEIARGGMGRVVEATDTLLGRTVALKEALATDPDALRRFVRETKITARLEHPSIVPVYDAGTTPDGTPFYVMRKVTGRPLDELVRAAPDLQGRLALLPHVVAATQALAHAHERGVVHRDVKPGNILVGNLGETVVIDWGLAKVVGEAEDAASPAPVTALPNDSLHTQFGVVFGTPGFMSPEQLRSSDVGPRSDVYALGATLYYVLARRPPHAGASSDAMMDAAAAGPPEALDALVRGVPAELVTIVTKALAFDDRDRYPHAGALAEDLTRFLTGQLVASHRYSPAQRTARFVRRYRAAVVASLAALAAVVAVGIYAFGRIGAERDAAQDQARAAVAARERETERADELVVSQARLLLDRDPTAALALVRPLAGGPRWREVHAIAAGAQAAGVAWRLPGGPIEDVALAPDGAHAAVLTAAGKLVIHDLAAHTERELAAVGAGPANVAYADNDHVVAYGGGVAALVIVDVATGRGRELTLDAAISRLVGAGGRVYWIDTHGHGWQLEPTSAPTRLLIDDELSDLAPAPDGTRVLACGVHGLWLASGGPAVRLFDHRTNTAAWADSGDRVVAVTTEDTIAIELTTPPRVRHLAGPGRIYVTVVGDTVYTLGVQGLEANGTVLYPRAVDGLRFARAGATALVAALDDGNLEVIDGEQRLPLAVPSHGVTVVATSRGSRRIVAVAAGAAFAWDLDAVLPRIVPLDRAGTLYGPAGPHTLFVGSSRGATWLDLATLATRPAPPSGAMVRLFLARVGEHIVFATVDGEAVLATLGAPDTLPLGGGVSVGTFVGADLFVSGDRTGALVAHAVTGPHAGTPGGVQPLATLGARIVKVTAAGTWALATAADGTLARARPAGPAPAEVLHPPAPPTDALITTAGRVLLVTGPALAWWEPGGALTAFGTLPRPAARLFPVDDDHAVVRDEAGVGYLLDLRTGLHPALEDSVGPDVHPVPDLALVVLPGPTGVRVLDVAAHATVGVARSWPSGIDPSLSRDGQFLFAAVPGRLLIWTLDVPVSAAATARWVGTLTNAHWDDASHAVTW